MSDDWKEFVWLLVGCVLMSLLAGEMFVYFVEMGRLI
jgi:hypothetical protein